MASLFAMWASVERPKNQEEQLLISGLLVEMRPTREGDQLRLVLRRRGNEWPQCFDDCPVVSVYVPRHGGVNVQLLDRVRVSGTLSSKGSMSAGSVVERVTPWYQVVRDERTTLLAREHVSSSSTSFVLYTGLYSPHADEYRSVPGLHRVCTVVDASITNKDGQFQRRMRVQIQQRQWMTAEEMRPDMKAIYMELMVWDNFFSALPGADLLTSAQWKDHLIKPSPPPFYAVCCVDDSYKPKNGAISLKLLGIQWDMSTFLERRCERIPECTAFPEEERDEVDDIICLNVTKYVPRNHRDWTFYAFPSAANPLLYYARHIAIDNKRQKK